MLALDLELALMGRQIDGPLQPREFRHVAIEAIDRGHADLGQHGAAVGLGQRQIAHQCSPSTEGFIGGLVHQLVELARVGEASS